MPTMPADTDRNRLVVVRPKDVPEGTEADQIPEHIVGAAYVTAFPDDVEFLRFEGESQEQADAREKAAAAAEAAAKSAAKTPAPSNADRFAQQ